MRWRNRTRFIYRLSWWITLNEALEYLLDDTGKTRIFQNQPEAEAFLLCHGFTSEDLEHFYFVEVPENEE